MIHHVKRHSKTELRAKKKISLKFKSVKKELSSKYLTSPKSKFLKDKKYSTKAIANLPDLNRDVSPPHQVKAIIGSKITKKFVNSITLDKKTTT
jgi:hypothetical protein